MPSLKDCSHRSLQELERVADANGWEHVRHMVRNERQVRMRHEQIQG